VSRLRVRVRSPEGHPLSDAKVELIGEHGATLPVPHHNLESYEAEQIPKGRYLLRVSAERLKTHEQRLELDRQALKEVEIKLEQAPVQGQIRGLVRSFGGQGITATIEVAPLGQSVETDEKGQFTIDVPAGRYDVEIRAEGFVTQRRRIAVEADGVTVLNADLQKGGR
jgi:hypothetical protein